MGLKIISALLALLICLPFPALALTRQELRGLWQQANILKSDASPYRPTVHMIYPRTTVVGPSFIYSSIR